MQLLSGRNRWFQAIVLTTSQAPTPKGELLSLFQIQELKTSQLRRCSRGKRRGSASPTAPELHFPLCCSASALTQALCLPKTPRGGSCSHLPAPGTSQGRGKGKAGEGWNSSEGKQSSQCLSTTPKPLLRPKPGVSASQNTQAQGAVLGIPAPGSLCHGGHSPRPLTPFMSTSSCKTPKTSPLPAPARLQQLETISLSSHNPRSKHSLKQ